MTRPLAPYLTLLSAGAIAALMLSGCASTGTSQKLDEKKPDPVTPTMQYTLSADSQTKSINLRVEPNGLSANQRRALDQVAARASWVNGEPVDVEIVTSGDPAALAAGQNIGAYLIGRDVAADALSSKSAQEQPSDVVTVNLVFYSAHTQECGQNWENLAATGANKTYANFGCAVTENLAAQIADPRDLDHPAPATPTDALRKSVILDHYSRGEVTSTTSTVDGKGTISDAIK